MARDLEDQAGIAQVASFVAPLTERSGGKCEFCKAESELVVYEVPPLTEPDIERSAFVCDTCNKQLEDLAELDADHWNCLNDTAWSSILAIQVATWQMLGRLDHHAWAHELRDQIYLDEANLEWAEAGLKQMQSDDDGEKTLDSNGTRLLDGDTVQVIKDLDVKGTGFVAKRGTIVKNIRLTGNPEHVEGRVNKTAIVLKTCFLKKA